MPSLDARQRMHLVTDMRCLVISWTQCSAAGARQKWGDAVHQIGPAANEKL